jgi:hypothetical protein
MRMGVVASLCLAVSGCVVVAPIGPYGPSEEMPPPEEDHTAEIIGGIAVGVLVTGLVAILVTRARANNEFTSRVPEGTDPVAISPALREKFARGLLAAQSNDCAMALAIDAELASSAPSFAARYAVEPPIAACRAGL